MSVSKKTSKSVKRPHVQWYEVYSDIGNPELAADFYRLLQKHPRMSLNRVAYNVLKKHYSTTSLDRCRWLGESL